jgi:CheY-like chemotaxis protein
MTFLFIDDDPDDTELFCEAISYINKSDFLDKAKSEFTCITATNGCRAIELLPQLDTLPDHIFVDINMPVMGGKECLTYLKAHPIFSKIPVTTSFQTQDADLLKRMGAQDCIRKPSDFKTLVQVLMKYVIVLCFHLTLFNCL